MIIEIQPVEIEQPKMSSVSPKKIVIEYDENGDEFAVALASIRDQNGRIIQDVKYELTPEEYKTWGEDNTAVWDALLRSCNFTKA